MLDRGKDLDNNRDNNGDNNRGNDDYKWYVLQVHSGSEKRVAELIKASVRRDELSGYFEKVLVPTEEVVEIKQGVRKNRERNFFPGYVLIKMQMTDKSYHLVKNIPKVISFLGDGGEAIKKREIDRILRQVEEGVDKPKPSVIFEIGEQVRVCDGPFASFNGVVEEVDEERARIKVSVSIFGRATPVDLDYVQVEKV